MTAGFSAQAATPDELTPDLETMLTFANLIFKNADPNGFVSLRAFADNGQQGPALFTQSLQLNDIDFASLLQERARQAATWFVPAVFCPPICTFKTDLNAKTDNIFQGVALSVDNDQQPLQARAKLQALLGEPTVVTASGGEWINEATGEVEPKGHQHWRLKAPTATPEEHALLREARLLAAQLTGGDPTSQSLVQPLRWPGSWHRKGTTKLAMIVASSEHEIDLAEAIEVLRTAAAAAGLAEIGKPPPTATERLRAGEESDVVAALALIPNGTDPKAHDWEYWNRIGMAIWTATEGSEAGRLAFHEWSSKSPRYVEATTETRWQHYFRSPPTKIGFGSLVFLARQTDPDWPPGASDFDWDAFAEDLDRLHDEYEAASGVFGPAPSVQAAALPAAPPIQLHEVPPHLLEVPGLVGEIMAFIVASAIQPQPILALGAALVLVGTAAGRLIAGPTRSGTHLYVIGLAESGAGKDHPITMVTVILTAAGLADHIGPSQFISMPSVINFLKRCPLAACAMDEYGSFLKRINNRKAGEFSASISGMLRTCWGASYKPMTTPEWAGTPSVIIQSPAMSIFGASTPEEFYAALEGCDILNGALNRFILLEASRITPARNKQPLPFDQVPQGIIDRLREIYNYVPTQTTPQKTKFPIQFHPRAFTSATVAPEYEAMAFSPEAEQIKEAMDDDIALKGRADKKLRPFLARVVENAIRLATIRAVGRQKLTVEAEDMVWGRDFMMWSTHRMADGAGLYIADSEPQALANAVKRALKGNGKVARSALLQALDHKYRAYDLKGALSLLIQSGDVLEEVVPSTSPQGGRPATWYTLQD